MLLTNITNMAWTLLLNKAGIKIFLFLLVFYSTFHCVTCEVKKCNAFDTPGVTIPEGDIILEHGESLEIFCKLHDHYMAQHPNVTSADIEFLKDNFVLPSEWVTKLNDSTARLYVEKPPPSSSFYICRIKSNLKAVCLNTVTVGTKPSEVQNFSCTAYNYENMTCSWTEPNHYVKTNYNLTYYFAGRGSRSIYMCPNITRRDDKGYCFWDLQTRPHYRQTQPNYYFSLNVSNDFGTIIQKITFSHFANVIPGPPENLTVLNKTSDSVTLSWSVRHPMIFFPPSVIHRVVFQSEYDKKDEWMVANTSSINKNNRPLFTLDSLKYAHALYDIRVSMISSKARISDDRMWSKNVSLTVRTLSALPGAPPKTTVGSFEIVNNKTGRDVYLYWQFIPEFMKNGENLTYRVIQVTDDFTTKVIEPVELTNSYAKIVSISYSKRYKFHIFSENEVGQSVNRSEIIVPAIAEQVKEPSSFTKISFGKQVYELSWIPPPDNNNTIKNYTIFYCRNDYDRPFQCKGLLKWIEVPSNTTLINMTVPEDRIYQFAISANSENSSSGMVWASCTVIHDKGFTKMKSIWINSIGSDYIEVGWKLDCSDRIGNIEGFIIYYCPIVSPVDAACNGSEQNITITGDPIASRGKITNLRPYTTYMLNVSVKSKHNNGLPSDPLYNTTLEGAPDPPENLTVNNITSNSITISWMPPKYMNGVIRFYEVRYFSNGGEYRRKTEDGKTHFMTLRNLHTYTEYNITVYAVTVKESNSSLTLSVKTAISVPAKMDSPSNKYQNDTLILVVWTPPSPAGGNLDLYELRVKEKVNSVNDTKYFNTSDTQFEITNCGNDRTYKVLYFSIRAINIDETLNKRYEGEWSDETEYYCRSSTGFIYWFAIACGVGILIFMVYILKKLWHHCKIMRDVEVKLPPGLTPTAPNDLSLNHWPVSTLQKPSTDDPLMHIRTDSSADEELLLAKKAECGESHDRIPSGDSSGCSSGHESVTSSLASGTNLSSSSDSGTEQPRTPSSESVSRENSLRQRRTGSETLGWDSEIAWPHPKGYVTTMPMSDKSGSPTWNTISPSNYCVLGVDTVTAATDNPIHGGYVPVPISIPHSEPAGKPLSSYITCDSIFNKPQPIGSGESSPAYVKSSDIIGRGTGIGLGVATTATVTSAVQPQQPTYVMAGNTNTSRPYVKPSALAAVAATTATGKLINIEPLHGVDVEAYMQHGSEIDSPTPYVKADELSSLKENDEHSYCRMGWDRDRNRTGGGGVGAGSPVSIPTAVPARAAVCEPAKGYVPHRQFENKSLKED